MISVKIYDSPFFLYLFYMGYDPMFRSKIYVYFSIHLKKKVILFIL